MSAMTCVVNAICRLNPELIIDSEDDPVTILVSGDWTKTARLLDGIGATTAAVTITHVAAGIHDIDFTPTAVGNWSVEYSVVVDGETVRFDPQFVQVQTAAQADPAGALNGNTVVISGPATASGDFRITQGNVYSIANGNPLTWTLTDAPDLTGETVTFSATGTALEVTCTVTGAGTSSQVVKAELTSDQTDALALTVRKYRLRATLADVDLAKGALIIQPAT